MSRNTKRTSITMPVDVWEMLDDISDALELGKQFGKRYQSRALEECVRVCHAELVKQDNPEPTVCENQP